MAVSKAQQRAVTKYDAKAYDKTLLRLPKGRLDIVKAHATAHGESVNGFIGRAILDAMERDGGGTASETAGKPAGAAQEAGVVSLPSETLETAQRAAERPQRPVYDAESVNRVLPINILKKAQEAADKRGESLPLFLAIAMEMRIDAEAEGSVTMPPEALQAAQEAAEARRETVSRFLTRAINTQIEKDKYERYRQEDQRRGK